MAQASSGIYDELVRRHRAAVRAVAAALGFASLLLLVAAVRWATSGTRTLNHLLDETLGRATPERAHDPYVTMLLWFGVAFLALGSIYYRRAKFQPVRLQAVAGLRGAAGLLETLQKTTVRVALVGAAIAALGFVSALLTGLFGDMLRAWLVSMVVLGYAYPRRGAWRRVVETADDLGAEAGPAAKGTYA